MDEGDRQLIDALQVATRDLLAVALASLDSADGVRLQHMRLMIAVHENPGAASVLLADSLGVSPSSITRQADRLCAAGYLSRQQHPENRRVVVLTLTPAGEQIVDDVLRRRATQFARVIPDVSPDLRVHLTRALGQLHAAFRPGGGQAQPPRLPPDAFSPEQRPRHVSDGQEGPMHKIEVKRIYEPPTESDGYRVLVDRLWPRGVSKEKADLDEWLKDIGPSTELRKWFNHDPERYAEFATRYRAELHGSDALARLRAICAAHTVVTLLFGARDTEHNEAVVLKDVVASPAADRE
jgi:DNA-3-methyladenine glycosylase